MIKEGLPRDQVKIQVGAEQFTRFKNSLSNRLKQLRKHAEELHEEKGIKKHHSRVKQLL